MNVECTNSDDSIDQKEISVIGIRRSCQVLIFVVPPKAMTSSSSYYIFLASLFASYIGSVTPGKLVDLMNVHDPAWETHLESSLVMLESNCHENDIPFNRVKVVSLQKHNCIAALLLLAWAA